MIEFDIAFRPGDDFAVTFGGEVPLDAEMGQVMEVLATEERTVELSMPYGNQVILPTSGKVMRKVDGKLVETYADGTETVIRSIHSPIKVTLGAKIKLQHRPSTAQ